MADEKQQTDTTQTATGSDQVSNVEGGERTFTQADVDRLITERLRRKDEQYADYDQLKEQAQEWQKIQDAKKSELDKANERLETLQGENAALAQRYNDALVRNAVTTKAAMMGFADPMDAYRMVTLENVQIDENGEAQGIDDLLKALSESKPYLLRQTTTGQIGATNPGRGSGTQETREQRRARIYGYGGDALSQDPTKLGGGVFVP